MKVFDKVLSLIALICLTSFMFGCLAGMCFNLDFFVYAKYLIGIPCAVLMCVFFVIATRGILK
jgi:hypothetical protein